MTDKLSLGIHYFRCLSPVPVFRRDSFSLNAANRDLRDRVHVHNRRGVRDDVAIWRKELNDEGKLAARRFRENEAQIPRLLYTISALLVAMSLAACDQSEEASDTPATESAEQPVAPPPEAADDLAEDPMDEGEVDDMTPPEEPVLETDEMIETDETVDDDGTVEDDVTIEEEETIEVPDEEQPQ